MTQEKFDSIERAFTEAFDRGAFTAGALAAEGADFSRVAFLGGASAESIWDLASLTKVVSTWSLLGQLLEAHELDTSSRVGSLLSLEGLPGSDLRLFELLTHTSGLKRSTRLDLYDDAQIASLAKTFLTEPLDDQPGSQVVYMNRGFILLGLVIERLGEGTLADQFGEFARKLDAEMWMANVPASLRSRQIEVHGAFDVHDPNARRLGGSAGHAGVFGTVAGLAAFGREVVESYFGNGLLPSPWVRSSLIPLFREGDTYRGLGWRTVVPAQSPHLVAFHYGFTGTGLFVDPESDLVVAFTTNSVSIQERHPELARFRNAALEALL